MYNRLFKLELFSFDLINVFIGVLPGNYTIIYFNDKLSKPSNRFQQQ